MTPYLARSLRAGIPGPPALTRWASSLRSAITNGAIASLRSPRGARIWFLGTRPKTLGAAVAPVVLGTAVAALVVALALQVGVNYANDYSDGVRGTDRERAGPLRLTASGLASPNAVR